MCKKEKFTQFYDPRQDPGPGTEHQGSGIRYNENLLFGLDKDNDPMYQLDLKLSKVNLLIFVNPSTRRLTSSPNSLSIWFMVGLVSSTVS